MYVIKIRKNQNTIQVRNNAADVKVVSLGKRGIAGEGLVAGGASGQYLRKASNADFDTEWHTPTSDDISDSGQSHRFVTAAQLTLIDNGVQPLDPISSLTNDAGYITDLSGFDTGDLAEGSNLYFTQARFNSAFAAKSTSDLPEGSNLYYTQSRFNTAFAGKTTDDLSEGATNLYYTNTRADARIAAQAGQANGLATLGSDGKIPTSQLPALAVTDTFVVASQAAMLALTAEVGDVAVRTDQNKSYILKTAGASTLANWQELLTPTDTVLSVNGQTGAVTLTTSNIAEGSNLYYTDARVQSYSDTHYLALSGGTLTGKLIMNVSGDFAIDMGSTPVKSNEIIIDGTPQAFNWPFVRFGVQPTAFIYLDSTYHILRIGTQKPSVYNTIAFELPNNNEYQDVMALTTAALAPASALNNALDLGGSSQRFKTLYLGTGLTLPASFTGVLKAASGVVSGGATTSDLTEGSNLYYTDERVDDRVASLLVAGVGISLTYNDGSNTLTIANELTAAPGTDTTASGPKVTLTAGENLVFGDVGYLKSDGKVWKGDADDAAKTPVLFFALGTINADASGSFALPGNMIRNDAWSWTVGGRIYLSQTAGGLTQTAPTATDTVTQVLGIAMSATRILFYPSIDYITHI